MIIYELHCTTEDGCYESNGFYMKRQNAETMKYYVDKQEQNLKYGIVQIISEREILDK
jgi:hypothetical protein